MTPHEVTSSQKILAIIGIDDYYVRNCIEWAYMPKSHGIHMTTIRIDSNMEEKLRDYSNQGILMTITSKFMENDKIQNVVPYIRTTMSGQRRTSIDLTVVIRN